MGKQFFHSEVTNRWLVLRATCGSFLVNGIKVPIYLIFHLEREGGKVQPNSEGCLT